MVTIRNDNGEERNMNVETLHAALEVVKNDFRRNDRDVKIEDIKPYKV
jgi:hypothetical protein